jgi:hypothetical protein
VLLHPIIDEFVDHELADYHVKLAQWSGSRSQATRPRPVEPQIAHDQLTSNDWSIVVSYLSLLKLCKQATMRLQGNVSTTTRRGLAVKGAIWQVLPIFDEISRVFEEARRMHLTAHSQRSQLNEAAPAQALAPGSSNTSIRQGSTRRSQAKPQRDTLCQSTYLRLILTKSDPSSHWGTFISLVKLRASQITPTLNTTSASTLMLAGRSWIITTS